MLPLEDIVQLRRRNTTYISARAPGIRLRTICGSQKLGGMHCIIKGAVVSAGHIHQMEKQALSYQGTQIPDIDILCHGKVATVIMQPRQEPQCSWKGSIALSRLQSL